jgi:hypothetical protein
MIYFLQLAITDDLRRPVYMCVAWNVLDLRQLLGHMSKVNWEVRDVMSQHSPYVDIVLRVINNYRQVLYQVQNFEIKPLCVLGATNLQYALSRS